MLSLGGLMGVAAFVAAARGRSEGADGSSATCLRLRSIFAGVALDDPSPLSCLCLRGVFAGFALDDSSPLSCLRFRGVFVLTELGFPFSDAVSPFLGRPR